MMKVFYYGSYVITSECEQCKEPHTYAKPYRTTCDECESKSLGEQEMAFKKDNPEYNVAPQVDPTAPVQISSTVGFPGQIPAVVTGNVTSVPVFYIPPTFEDELRSLINKFSKENASNTPDFILTVYILDALEAFNKAVAKREQWYGRKVF